MLVTSAGDGNGVCAIVLVTSAGDEYGVAEKAKLVIKIESSTFAAYGYIFAPVGSVSTVSISPELFLINIYCL